MANQGDTQILQVVGGQARQQRDCDGILAECCLVLLKTERSKPVCDVHGRSPP